jgi:hypothetical protein
MLIAISVPVVILMISLILSLKCFVCRKTIGKAVALIGILEMIGFFMFTITIGNTEYIVPYEARMIIFLQGFLTILSGVATSVSAKPKKQKIYRNH